MSEPSADYRKYLDPRTLARVQSLDLRARLIVEGLMTGMHRSPYQGISVEFAQHRQYVPGDDIRHVDWKVFAKPFQIGTVWVTWASKLAEMIGAAGALQDADVARIASELGERLPPEIPTASS